MFLKLQIFQKKTIIVFEILMQSRSYTAVGCASNSPIPQVTLVKFLLDSNFSQSETQGFKKIDGKKI